jgi:hypothetical protein
VSIQKQENIYILNERSEKPPSRPLKGLPVDKKWDKDANTISHLEIDGFNAKYYKYLPGGHRITFKLRKKTNPE